MPGTFTNNKTPQGLPEIKYPHNNMRTMDCLDKLISNLSRIPIGELENLTDKYSL